MELDFAVTSKVFVRSRSEEYWSESFSVMDSHPYTNEDLLLRNRAITENVQVQLFRVLVYLGNNMPAKQSSEHLGMPFLHWPRRF